MTEGAMHASKFMRAGRAASTFEHMIFSMRTRALSLATPIFHFRAADYL